MILNILAAACPLLLCSIGALYSEYAGVLALFMEGLISFSAFLTFLFSTGFHSQVVGFIVAVIISVALVFVFGLIVQKLKGQVFISAIAMNLLFSSFVSFFSYSVYHTRGVLTSPNFAIDLKMAQLTSVIISALVIVAGILIFAYSRFGLYVRITGSDSEVLLAKGVNPVYCRIGAWCVSAFYAAVAGGLLTFRLSSFVPNIASGRGWMALAAVFLGRKKPVRICIVVFFFCLADVFAANIQNFFPAIPSSLIISLPYLVALIMISISSEK